MAPTKTVASKSATVRPRVLVVEDEASLQEMIADTVTPTVGCRTVAATSIAQARRILESQRVDLMVVDRTLPDGDGLSLVPVLHLHHPGAQAIVMTGRVSIDGAIEAIREGATDFVPKPFTGRELAERVQRALERSAETAKKEKRLLRLKDAVKRLNDARKMVSKKVDLLCNDLITAYGELSRQLDQVRLQESYKHSISQARDLEQLLCNTMDWMLRQLGYANIAIWLAGGDEEMQLGAYMKYTIPGELALTDALRQGIVKQALRDNVVHLAGPALRDRLTQAEAEFLQGQDVLAFNCTYLAESLGVVVLFRDARTPFKEEDEQAMKTLCALFALALATIVKGHEGGEEGDPPSGGDSSLLDDTNTDQPPKKQRRKDDADWWKRGEEPPF